MSDTDIIELRRLVQGLEARVLKLESSAVSNDAERVIVHSDTREGWRYRCMQLQDELGKQTERADGWNRRCLEAEERNGVLLARVDELESGIKIAHEETAKAREVEYERGFVDGKSYVPPEIKELKAKLKDTESQFSTLYLANESLVRHLESSRKAWVEVAKLAEAWGKP